MRRLVWILGFTFLGSVGALGLAGLFSVLSERARTLFVPSLISYATGTLLGGAFLGLIPHALRYDVPASSVLSTVLFGIVLFFILEKLVVWRHCHDESC
jgi:zinc and cadmium transporter